MSLRVTAGASSLMSYLISYLGQTELQDCLFNYTADGRDLGGRLFVYVCLSEVLHLCVIRQISDLCVWNQYCVLYMAVIVIGD